MPINPADKSRALPRLQGLLQQAQNVLDSVAVNNAINEVNPQAPAQFHAALTLLATTIQQIHAA